MISDNDLVTIAISDADLERCAELAAAYPLQPSTAQYKALGALALQRLIGVPDDAYARQAIEAAQLRVAFCCGQPGNKLGVATTVSVISDASVLKKRVCVPLGQLITHPELSEHVTVGFFVLGRTENKCLVHVDRMWAAGWMPTRELRQHKRTEEQSSPFSDNCKLRAEAYCTELRPLATLLPQLHEEDES